MSPPRGQPRAACTKLVHCLSRSPCSQSLQNKPHDCEHDTISYRREDLQILDGMIRCCTEDIKRIEELQKRVVEARANLSNWLAASSTQSRKKRIAGVEPGKSTHVESTKVISKRAKLENTYSHVAPWKRLASQKLQLPPKRHSLLGSMAKSLQQIKHLPTAPLGDPNPVGSKRGSTRRNHISSNTSAPYCIPSKSAKTATSASVTITRPPLSTLVAISTKSSKHSPSMKAYTNNKIDKAIEIGRRGVSQSTKKLGKTERCVRWL